MTCPILTSMNTNDMIPTFNFRLQRIKVVSRIAPCSILAEGRKIQEEQALTV